MGDRAVAPSPSDRAYLVLGRVVGQPLRRLKTRTRWQFFSRAQGFNDEACQSSSRKMLDGGAECGDTVETLQKRVAELEAEVTKARHGLITTDKPNDVSALHHLLILSDSALPLGAFAFSAGLESFIAHEQPRALVHAPAFNHFLLMSLDSVADTTLPYVLHSFNNPSRLAELDNDLDASITCAVARRASVSQGRALLAIWERSLRAQLRTALPQGASVAACEALEAFCRSLKLSSLARAQSSPESAAMFGPNGHLPPCFGVVGAILTVPLEQLLYTYLLNHAKMLLSAGIRASVLGPYQAQGLLASQWLQAHIWALTREELKCPREPQDAGQCAPLIDLWGGRHEIIYSRIFNS